MMTKKKRHIKTFPEKFGDGVVTSEEIQQVLVDNKKEDAETTFDRLPYIGYLRVQASSDFGDWWYDSNDDWVNAKIIGIKKDRVELYHYDSHHDAIAFRSVKFEGYCVEGNVLIKCPVDNPTE